MGDGTASEAHRQASLCELRKWLVLGAPLLGRNENTHSAGQARGHVTKRTVHPRRVLGESWEPRRGCGEAECVTVPPGALGERAVWF